ncbi:conserved protein, unknown function, partial [Hepatocystis sp. ex Piliocolobus tephrosceles]
KLSLKNMSLVAMSCSNLYYHNKFLIKIMLANVLKLYNIFYKSNDNKLIKKSELNNDYMSLTNKNFELVLFKTIWQFLIICMQTKHFLTKILDIDQTKNTIKILNDIYKSLYFIQGFKNIIYTLNYLKAKLLLLLRNKLNIMVNFDGDNKLKFNDTLLEEINLSELKENDLSTLHLFFMTYFDTNTFINLFFLYNKILFITIYKNNEYTFGKNIIEPNNNFVYYILKMYGNYLEVLSLINLRGNDRIFEQKKKKECLENMAIYFPSMSFYCILASLWSDRGEQKNVKLLDTKEINEQFMCSVRQVNNVKNGVLKNNCSSYYPNDKYYNDNYHNDTDAYNSDYEISRGNKHEQTNEDTYEPQNKHKNVNLSKCSNNKNRQDNEQFECVKNKKGNYIINVDNIFLIFFKYIKFIRDSNFLHDEQNDGINNLYHVVRFYYIYKKIFRKCDISTCINENNYNDIFPLFIVQLLKKKKIKKIAIDKFFFYSNQRKFMNARNSDYFVNTLIYDYFYYFFNKHT